MYFANPWGLLGLLAMPAIVLIHMYHRRFPPQLVAGLHLWGAEIKQPTSGRKLERLPISSSLILELLVALLLSLILSQPRFGEIDRVVHLIAVVDGSASMGAVGAEGVSFRDLALGEVRRRMQAAPRGSRVTVVATGRRPTMIAGPAIAWEDAAPMLANWQPTATKHDFGPALDLAAQWAESSGDVLFLTDTLPSVEAAIPESVEVLSVGHSLSNVALIAAKWNVDPQTLKGQIFVRLANRGAREVESKVTGRAGERIVFSSTVKLAGNAEQSFEAEVSGGTGEVRVTVETANDPLAIDNVAVLVEPRARVVKATIALSEMHSASDALRRVFKTLPNVRMVPADESQLIVGKGDELPPPRRDLWWLGVGPLDASEAARKASKHLTGPFLIDKRHSLMDGVVLSGVVWTGVQPVTLDVRPIISSGNQFLLSQLNGTPTTAFLLNLDVGSSNLTETPDWPILLSNLVEQRRQALPGLRQWNYRLNEEIAFRLFEGAEAESASDRPLTLEFAGESKRLARTALVELPTLDRTGIYVVKDGESEFDRFAVNFFDLAESTLSDLKSGQRVPPASAKTDGWEVDTALTWTLLLALLIAMCLIFADWRVLMRKRRAA